MGRGASDFRVSRRGSYRSRRSNLNVSRKKTIPRTARTIVERHMDDKGFPPPPPPPPPYPSCHLFLFLHFHPHPSLTRGHLFPSTEKNQFDAIRDTQDPGRTSSAFCRKGSRESGRNSCCTFLSTQEDARKERGENDENSRNESGTAVLVTLPDPAPCFEDLGNRVSRAVARDPSAVDSSRGR